MDNLRPPVSRDKQGFLFNPYRSKGVRRWGSYVGEFPYLMVSIYYSFLGLSLLVLLSCGGGGVSETPKATQPENNHPPVAFAGPNQNVLTGSIVTLDGSGSYDPDNDSLTYSWALTQVPNGSTAILSNPTALRPTFIPNVSGVYVARLIVSETKADTGKACDEGPQQEVTSETSYVTITASTALEPPPPPSTVSVIAGDRQLTILWPSQETGGAVTSHNIYWSATAGVTKQSGIKISGAINPYTHKDLTNGIKYYYVVTAVNEYGEGRVSVEASATPFLSALPAPTGVTAVAGDRQATISWDAVNNATTYNIYWSASPDASIQSRTKLANVKSPYIHSGLTQGMTYCYVVTAANGSGESVDSAKASVTIPDNLTDIFVAMGGSITKGYLLNNYDDCYVARLSRLWGKAAVNKGVTGAKSSDGTSIIGPILSEQNPRYLTVYYGSNDLGFYTNDLIVNNLRFIIIKAKENGTIPVIATLGPFLGESSWRQPLATELNKKIRQMAAEQGIACADLEAALNGDSAYMSWDGMHPNSAGHQVIANAFYKALTQ